MKKVIRLTERDLTRIVKSFIKEEETMSGDTQQVDYSKYGGKKPVFTNKWGWEDEDGEWHDFPTEPSEWEKQHSKDKRVRMDKNEEIDKKIREPLKKHGKDDSPETIIVWALILAKKGEESPSDLAKYLVARFKKIEMRPDTRFNSFDNAQP